MSQYIPRQRNGFSISTVLLVVTAGILAVGVFITTQSVKQHEASVRKLGAQILSEQQTIRILDAEWAYLTRPQRLEELMALKQPTETETTAQNLAKIAEAETTAALEPASGTPEKTKNTEKTEKPVTLAPVATTQQKPAAPAPKAVTTNTPAKPETHTKVAHTQPEKPAKTETSSKKETPQKLAQNAGDDLIWSPKMNTRAKTAAANPVVAQNRIYAKHGGIARPIIE